MDTRKFEYFCSRAAAGIGILILGFLSLFSLFYTEEFTKNRAEELELVNPDNLPLVLVVNGRGEVVFLSQGYSIGLGAQVLKQLK